jgi:3D-(3,5/4)-trihydroxycyclohexane-1,2-dione acylhydrolase (decyclizing)
VRLGAISRKVTSVAELERALPEARAERRTSVIVIATDPTASTGVGGAWWDVAVPEVSNRAEVALRPRGLRHRAKPAAAHQLIVARPW